MFPFVPRRSGPPRFAKSMTQVEVLEAAFRECPTPDRRTLHQIAAIGQLSPEQVQRWFRNKRHRQRCIARARKSAR